MNLLSIDQWQKENDWESTWWGECFNTYGEETKQLAYAKMMGLGVSSEVQHPYYDLEGKSVLDIGGGPVSLLLKCVNRGRSVVADPLTIPHWALDRYRAADILFKNVQAERLIEDACFESEEIFDEVWMYNVLQHTQNPQLIVENARKLGKVIRFFDWIDTLVEPGHPQILKEKDLNEWLHGVGKVHQLDRKVWVSYCRAYYGVFPTDLYGTVVVQ